MKSKSLWVLTVLLLGGVSLAARASRENSKISCEDFLKLEEPQRAQMVYWLDGAHRKDMSGTEDLDFSQKDKWVRSLVEVCMQQPKTTLANQLIVLRKK